MNAVKVVYLLCIGSGEDGDAMYVDKVFVTREAAQRELATYSTQATSGPDPRIYLAEFPVEDTE